MSLSRFKKLTFSLGYVRYCKGTVLNVGAVDCGGESWAPAPLKSHITLEQSHPHTQPLTNYHSTYPQHTSSLIFYLDFSGTSLS